MWSCRRLCDDDDDLSEVTAAEAVPTQVRDWLTLTFTRSMSSLKKSTQDKPKFRSVAHVIRAGIMVDRLVLVYSAVTNLLFCYPTCMFSICVVVLELVKSE